MSDSLVQAVGRARTWPKGSGARLTLMKAAEQLATKREREILDTQALLDRQWEWLERNGSPGEDGENSERYEDGMLRFLATLADYEDLLDGLNIARNELEKLAA